MKNTYALSLAFLFFLSCGTTSEKNESSSSKPISAENLDEAIAQISDEKQYNNDSDRLNDLFEVYGDWQNISSPITATFMGNSDYNDVWDDVSPAGYQRNVKALGRFNELRDDFNPEFLSSEERNNLGILSTYLENTYTLNSTYPEHYLQIDQVGGTHTFLPSIFRLMPKNNKGDLENMKARLEKIPTVFEQLEETLTEAIEKDIMMPKTTQMAVADQLRSLMSEDPEKSAFYSAFADLPEGIGLNAEDFQTDVKAVISDQVNPAIQKFLTFYENEYFPKTRETFGMSELPNGEAWYNERIRFHTTTDMTAKEIHELGKSEVARIHAEMKKVKEEANFDGDLEAFNEFLRTDPRFYFDTAEELLKEYRDICKRVDAELPKLFRLMPRLPYGVIAVPSYSEQSTTTAYYNPGSIENGTPGYFYANTYNLKTRPKWEMEALSIHEAVPGHHFQIALAQEMENTPDFRKSIFFTAFVEGWGLYTESLGAELGMYKDPYSKYGQLTYEMWRAVRLVVDTGIHAFGWTRQESIDYFKSYSSKQERDITVEIDRYIAWPGQALAYKIGELKIKELKQRAKDALGEDFDIRDFHDEVLKNGTIPLDVLEANIDKWIREKGAEAEE